MDRVDSIIHSKLVIIKPRKKSIKGKYTFNYNHLFRKAGIFQIDDLNFRISIWNQSSLSQFKCLKKTILETLFEYHRKRRGQKIKSKDRLNQ